MLAKENMWFLPNVMSERTIVELPFKMVLLTWNYHSASSAFIFFLFLISPLLYFQRALSAVN